MQERDSFPVNAGFSWKEGETVNKSAVLWTWAAFHWPDRCGWSCWSAQWNKTFRRIGSSGTSQNGDPNRSNMADALATYWRRVSIWILQPIYRTVLPKWCNLLWIWYHFTEIDFTPTISFSLFKVLIFRTHTCEPVASKMLEKFTGELAKKRENFVGLRYVKNVGK